MSFDVVINGPVAKAGSKPYFFNTKGMNVPKAAANRITANNEDPIVRLNANGKLTAKL